MHHPFSFFIFQGVWFSSWMLQREEKQGMKKRVKINFFTFQFLSAAFQCGTGNLHLLIVVNKMNVLVPCYMGRFWLQVLITANIQNRTIFPGHVFLEIYVLQITGDSTCCSSGANLNQNLQDPLQGCSVSHLPEVRQRLMPSKSLLH